MFRVNRLTLELMYAYGGGQARERDTLTMILILTGFLESLVSDGTELEESKRQSC